jgi:hypothetical protein
VTTSSQRFLVEVKERERERERESASARTCSTRFPSRKAISFRSRSSGDAPSQQFGTGGWSVEHSAGSSSCGGFGHAVDRIASSDLHHRTCAPDSAFRENGNETDEKEDGEQRRRQTEFRQQQPTNRQLSQNQSGKAGIVHEKAG